MPESSTFKDIRSTFYESHPLLCPCKKSAKNDFKSYEISEEVSVNNEEAALKVLLFDQALEAQRRKSW